MRARKVFLIVILALSFQSVFAQPKNSDITIKIKDGKYFVSGVLQNEDVKNEVIGKTSAALGPNVRYDLNVSRWVADFDAEWREDFGKTLAVARRMRSGMVNFSSPPRTDRLPSNVMNAEILLVGEKVPVHLADFGKKRMVFFLIESWCGPCISPADYLNDLYPYLKENGIEVIGVSSETSELEKKEFRYFARHGKYQYKLGWIDPRIYKTLFSISRFSAVPQFYLLTGEKVDGIFIGGAPRVNADMKKAIDDIWVNGSVK
jgi:thiol-disulfide isomerase/thioredoxin